MIVAGDALTVGGMRWKDGNLDAPTVLLAAQELETVMHRMMNTQFGVVVIKLPSVLLSSC